MGSASVQVVPYAPFGVTRSVRVAFSAIWHAHPVEEVWINEPPGCSSRGTADMS
jgi:hypothetical protein